MSRVRRILRDEMSGFDDVSWDVARNEFKINWFGPVTLILATQFFIDTAIFAPLRLILWVAIAMSGDRSLTWYFMRCVSFSSDAIYSNKGTLGYKTS